MSIKATLKKSIARVGLVPLRQRSYRSLRARARRGDLYPIALAELEAVWRHHEFTHLAENQRRVELLADLDGTQPSEAMHLLGWLTESLEVDGVVCEMGCASGATSALIGNEIRSTDRQIWIFDSFSGLSRPTAEDELIDDIFDRGSMAAYEGAMSYPESSVRARLASVGFPVARTNIVAGFVPDSFARSGLPEKVSFAYVDFDLYAPILAGLEWLDDRLQVGGIVMVDDYGWFSSGAQTAVDQFVESSPGRYEVRKVEAWAGHFIGLKRLA